MVLVLNNTTIEARASDSFVNATQMCKAGGKHFKHWYSLDSTKDLIIELKKVLNVGITTYEKLVDTTKGRYGGSWVHPDLAVQLAQWISPVFAIQVSRWVRELVLTGSVSIDTKKTDQELMKLQQQVALLESENKELETENKEQYAELKEQSAALEEKDEQLNRLHNIQKELVSYKKRMSRDESIYIVSSAAYARQGLYKVGRTKCPIKARNSGHNNTRVTGDKFKVLREFRVNDSVLVERNVHTKLKGLIPELEKEFLFCPYTMLESIVDAIVRNDDAENDLVDGIIDAVYALKQQQFNQEVWMRGVPEGVLDEPLPAVAPPRIQLAEGTRDLAQFDIKDWTDAEKKMFVGRCITAYMEVQQQHDASAQALIAWMDFQPFFQEILRQFCAQIKYKALAWKPTFKDAAQQSNLAVKWRG